MRVQFRVQSACTPADGRRLYEPSTQMHASALSRFYSSNRLTNRSSLVNKQERTKKYWKFSFNVNVNDKSKLQVGAPEIRVLNLLGLEPLT